MRLSENKSAVGRKEHCVNKLEFSSHSVIQIGTLCASVLGSQR